MMTPYCVLLAVSIGVWKFVLFAFGIGLWILAAARLLERISEDGYRRRSMLLRSVVRHGSLRLWGAGFALLSSMALLILLCTADWKDFRAASDNSQATVQTRQHAPEVKPEQPKDQTPTGSDSVAMSAPLTLMIVGGLLLFASVRGRKAFVSAFAGSTMLILGMTPTLKNELHLGATISRPAGAPSRKSSFVIHRTTVSIGNVIGFAPGCGDITGSVCSSSQKLQFVIYGQPPTGTSAALFNQVCRQTDRVDLVGRTDRARLSSALQSRYESNVGLAQTRAEGVREAILSYCADKSLGPPFLFTQIAGPRHVPGLVTGLPHPDPGYEGDRSVEITASTEAITGDELDAGNPSSAALAARWGIAEVVCIVLLALVLALLSSKYSGKVNLFTGEASLSGERTSGKDQLTTHTRSKSRNRVP